MELMIGHCALLHLADGCGTSLTGIGPDSKVQIDGQNQDQFRGARRARPRRAGSRCTGRSRPRSGTRSAPGGCRAARRCRLRGCWPPTSASPAAWWSRPTSSSSPRVTWPATRADTPRWRPARRRPRPGFSLAPQGPAADRPQLRPRRRVQLPPGRLAARDPRGARRPRRTTCSATWPGSGVPQLRTAIADYLNRVRGTVAEPGADRDLHRLRAGHRAAHQRPGRRGRETAGAGGSLLRRRRPAGRHGRPG